MQNFWKFNESKQAKGSSKEDRDCRLTATPLGIQIEMKSCKTFTCKQGEPEPPPHKAPENPHTKCILIGDLICCYQNYWWFFYLEFDSLKQ